MRKAGGPWTAGWLLERIWLAPPPRGVRHKSGWRSAAARDRSKRLRDQLQRLLGISSGSFAAAMEFEKSTRVLFRTDPDREHLCDDMPLLGTSFTGSRMTNRKSETSDASLPGRYADSWKELQAPLLGLSRLALAARIESLAVLLF